MIDFSGDFIQGKMRDGKKKALLEARDIAGVEYLKEEQKVAALMEMRDGAAVSANKGYGDMRRAERIERDEFASRAKVSIFNTKFVVSNTRFIISNTEFVISKTKFILFDTDGLSKGAAGQSEGGVEVRR